jgi:glycerol kinase
MLYNIHKRTWDTMLLDALQIPREILPEVCPSSQVYGLSHPAALLGVELPIAGIAGDQQAALFGQDCFSPGMAKSTYGTGGFLLLHTGTMPVPSPHGLLTAVAWDLGERIEYALEGSVFTAGSVIQWLRDGLQVLATAETSEAVAAEASDSHGVYLVPAFVGLGAPHWDPYARGIIIGLTHEVNRAHLVRAALEAIAYQTRDVVELMQQDAGLQMPEIRVDGGAAANNLLLQIQADLLGIPLVRASDVETTARGAAYLAGLVTGVWSSQADIAASWQAGTCFTPDMPSERRDQLYAGWRRAVERAKGWASPDLTNP